MLIRLAVNLSLFQKLALSVSEQNSCFNIISLQLPTKVVSISSNALTITLIIYHLTKGSYGKFSHS